MNLKIMCFLRIPFLICIFLINFCSSKGENSTSGPVPAPPRLRENAPEYFEVPLGEKVKLRCAVSGVPKPFVEWFKNDMKVSSTSDRVKITRNSLTIENVTYSDTDIYYCKASNDHGTIWKNFSVKAIEKELLDEFYADDSLIRTRTFVKPGEKFAPYFSNPNKMQRLIARIAGSPVTLPCRANGNPEPKIHWLKDGKPLEENIRDLNLHIIIRKWSLSIDHLIEKDSGSYECHVSNELGSVGFKFEIDVQQRVPHKPLFEDGFPSNTTVHVGGDARFECRFISDLQPRMRWLRHYNATDNSEAPYIEALDSKDPNQTDPHILLIKNVTSENEGWYTCLAGNALGVNYKSAFLTVLNYEENKFLALSENSGTSPYLVALLATFVSILICIIVVIFVGLFYRHVKKRDARKNKRKELPMTITKKVILERDVNGSHSIVPFVKIDGGSLIPEYIIPTDPKYEFPRERLILKNVLGEGAFGQVLKAEAFGLNGAEGTVTVAVKRLKDAHDDAEVAVLVAELELMKAIGKHTNIISLEGCCTQGGPLYIIMEYAEKGNLRDFLRSHRPPTENILMAVNSKCDYMIANGTNPSLTLKQLLSFALQVAKGMLYLASKKCVHRDLAARNVLLTATNVVKIADFGLARDIHSNDYYKKTTRGRLPVKWMALEALSERLYSTASDVWSFGVLLWEIMTIGSTPYATVPCVELYKTLKEGHRLAKPEHCPLDVYMLMLDCWQEYPQDRPTFSDITRVLDRVLLEACVESTYLELDFPVIDTPENSSSGEEN